ncbi:hypothetical protein [Mesorhizobium sp.]|uniref:hypothetical protein n=1 Tax=Mesorhizobium sp. TaxID=1871066 RepID=UPI0011F5FAF9|nr:hypothetical protein [Mesorhizobium sp.]TIM07623.1 MAG: hypothetical protein E5Y62_18850 [Mesorhizobium sp.]
MRELAPLTVPQNECFVLHCTNLAVNRMALRIKMPRGTLKVKTYRELRTRERDRRVPVLKMGSVYFIWWSDKQKRG